MHFVVVFNLTRFAWTSTTTSRCARLQSLGISLRSAMEPIDDTSTRKLMEGVLAAFAQFDNDCQSDRACQDFATGRFTKNEVRKRVVAPA